MKKLIGLILVSGLVLLAACSNGEVSSGSTKKQDETNRSEAATTTAVNSQLPRDYTDPEILVSFLAPDYHQTSSGYSRLFTANNYFIIFCRGGEKKEMPLADINDYNFQTFDYSTGAEISFGRPQTMATEISEEMSINGIDTLRFEGSIHYFQSFNNTETDNYVMGYTFYVKGIPCQLLGVSTDAEKKPETAESIKKDVDAMMQTISIN